MPSPYISELTLPTGSTYSIKDSEARELIAAINNWDYVVCTSASNTPRGVTWDDDGTTITGTLDPSSSTMYKIYLVSAVDEAQNDIFEEYITVNPSGSTYNWEKFGSVSAPDLSNYLSKDEAGALAYKDSVSGTVDGIPKTFTTATTIATTDSASVSVSGTTTGSVSLTKSNVEIKTKNSGTNKYTPSGSNSTSSVSGTCAVTPSGSISVGTGTANYTPSGSVGVSSAGSTTTIKNPTSKTVVTDMSISAPSSTQATGELVYCSVSGETLTLSKFVETTGASITTENVSVKNGDASYSFSGDGTQLKFTGSSSSGTISGTAAAQTFTGDDVYLETASQVGTDASFSGSSMTSTGTVAVPNTFTSTTSVDTTESKSLNITVS